MSSNSLSVAKLSCPLPLRDYPHVVIGHGGGGKLSAELIEHLLVPAFRNKTLEQLTDSAVLPRTSRRLAFSTDSYVVRPLFFPGGSIGRLAINGTVNDLAMSGAKPLHLSAGFIIEEGFSMEMLTQVVQAMADAATAAGVQIVTGDTKVVDRGHGDGIYINTSGIGELLDETINWSAQQIQPGDAVIVSGTIGDHGMAIMSVREGLEFESVIQSDSAPLHSLVQTMVETEATIRVMRDPTRGGVASSLNELAAAAQVGIEINESALPVNSTTQSACELLGMDPIYVANEGKLLAFVAAEDADKVLAAMTNHEYGRAAAVIGHVTSGHPAVVVARTAIGGQRVIAMQIGEQLPRIC